MLLADVVETLISRGRELREAGVRDLKIGELAVTFAPPDPPAVVDEAPKRELPPHLDPETYGLPPGSKIPGYSRSDS